MTVASPSIGPLFDPRLPAARESSRRLAALLRREQHGIGDFLVALAEFDRERLWARLGHANLFAYLHHDLGLSNAAAYHRRVAAELIQRFPEVVEPLGDGRLSVTRVVDLARVMTEDNRSEALARFCQEPRRAA
jgi:hypothetical protein